MSRRLLREYYLLTRSEQRSLLILSALLILGVAARLTVQFLPGKDPPGMEEFRKESKEIMEALAAPDTCPGQYEQVEQRGRIMPMPPININVADSIELLPLPGVGPVFAGRIIKYRELLGGFCDVDQLREVYGFPEETVQTIGHLITLDSTDIRQLIVNRASFSELLRHPYLELEDVRNIADYRNVRGRIGSLREMEVHGLLADSTLKKISPYLNFKN